MAQDDSQRDSERQQGEDEPRVQGAESSGRRREGAEPLSGGDASVISTADPTVVNPPQGPEDWQQDPNATVSLETNQIRAARPSRSGLPPMVVLTPHGQGEGDPKKGKPSQGESGTSKGEQDESQADDEKSSKSKDGGSRDKGKGHDQNKGDNDKKSPSGKQGKGSGAEDSHEDAQDSSDRDQDSDREWGERTTQPSSMKIMLMAGAVALVCGILGAVGYDYFFGKKSDDKKDDKQASSSDKKSGGGSKHKSGSSKNNKGSDEEETGSASNEGQTIPGFTTTADADSLRKQIGHLSEQLYAMQHRIDLLSRNREETPPDLHTLQIKMTELAQTVDEVADLPSKVRQASNRLESLEQKFKLIRDRLNEKQDEASNRPMVVYEGGPNGAPAPAPAPPPGVPPVSDADVAQPGDPALQQSIELLKLGVYDRAANILKRLRETEPDDPRVWYFSAVAHGLTTGDWQGETQRFAEKGVECERAGTIPRAAIDRALRGLSRTQGADWLANYRDRVGKKS